MTLAANAYGSRVIRNFRADLRTQLVLGTFAMTIVYCLVVLRSVHGKAPAREVPHASVTIGTVLTLASVLSLLVFIQGVARSIVADEVVRRVRRETDEAILALPELDADQPPSMRRLICPSILNRGPCLSRCRETDMFRRWN